MGICSSSERKRKDTNDSLSKSNSSSYRKFSGDTSRKNITSGIINTYGISKFQAKVEPLNDINEPIKFVFYISKIRCRMLQDKNFYIMKIIFDGQEFVLPLVSGSNPKMSFEQTITKDIKYDQLETKYLEVLLYSLPSDFDIYKYNTKEKMLENASLYSGFKVDLLTIAVGPECHNILLLAAQDNTAHVGRVMYTITCKQVSKIKININSVKIEFNNLLQNNVSLKANYKDIKINSQSKYTNALEPTLLNKPNKTVYDYHSDQNVPLIFNTISSMIDLRQAESSINVYSIRLIDKSNNPDINNSNLGTNTQAQDNKNPNINLINSYTLIGYGILNFVDILSENENALNKQSSLFFRQVSGFNNHGEKSLSVNTAERHVFKFNIFQDVEQNYISPLYLDGLEIGSVQAFIQIQNIPFMRQIMCGVMTENGFEINSIHLYDNLISGGVQSSLPSEVTELIQKKKDLNTELGKQKETQDNNRNILVILRSVKDILKKSIEENCLYYGYSDNADLLTGQGIMLDIGVTLLKVVDKVNKEPRENIIDILKLINERDEFDIGTISTKWFKEKELNKPEEVIFSDNILLKNKIIENFIEFNLNCLEYSLNIVNRDKTADSYSKEFSEYFLSLAYFRIPSFRDEVLKSLSSGMNQNSSLKKFSGHLSFEEFMSADPINNLIMWESLFYEKLTSALKICSNNPAEMIENDIAEKLRKINAISNSNEKNVEVWKTKFATRDRPFFLLIKGIVLYLKNKNEANDNINWFNIPGFEILLQGIEEEIKVRRLRSYPTYLMEIFGLFLNSPDITNKLVKLVMMNTNVYDSTAVFNFIDVVSTIFKNHLTLNPNKIYSKFNYTLLGKAMNLIINSEHSYCISKVILFYYDFAHIIPPSHLGEMCNSIFILHFYKFFFHWSFEVREKFFYFLTFTLKFKVSDMVPLDEGQDLKYESISNGINLRKTFKDIVEEKLLLIDQLQKIMKEEHFDPSFNNILPKEKYKAILKKIPEEVQKNIVVSLHHFQKVDEEFREFVNNFSCKKKENIEYPVLYLIMLKDDNVEYK